MGNELDKILPGLYIGDVNDAFNADKLKAKKITHIVSVYENARPIFKDKIYLCISASDTINQDLLKFIPQCNTFIHSARLDGGNVLIHCMAGVSRSATLAAAYIMSVTNLTWDQALGVIKAVRPIVSPNYGFLRQLIAYQNSFANKERDHIHNAYPSLTCDDGKCTKRLLLKYKGSSLF